MKIRPMGAELFHADGRTDMTNVLFFFFWMIPQRLNFLCRRFGTLGSVYIGGVSRKFEIKRRDEVTRQKKPVSAVKGNNRYLF